MNTTIRKQLVNHVTNEMGYYIRRGSKDIEGLFRDVVGTAPNRFEAELDRLEDSSRAWTRFKNEVMREARRERNLHVIYKGGE